MPAEGKFSRPPSGTELSADGMRELLGAKQPGGAPTIDTGTPNEVGDIPSQLLAGAAQALGGTVVGLEEDTQELEGADAQPEREDTVDVNDRREYIRTLLAGEPFRKRYSLYGGNIAVEMRTRTVTENDEVDIQLKKPEFAEFLLSKSPAILREKLRMAVTVTALTVGSKKLDVTFEAFATMPELTFLAVRDAYREFEKLCDVLYERANDSDFWRGIAGAI